MTEGTIGPIPITHAHLYDDNNININGEENFTITLPNTEARQIMGLASTNNTHETYNNITTSTTNNPWGIVYLDTSNTLKDNEDILHRGWYLITGAEPTTDLGAEYVHLQVTAIKLSPNTTEYFEMTYTPGVEDGTQLDNDYDASITETIFHEDFTNPTYTTYFDEYNNGGATNITVTPNGGKLELTGQSTANGTAVGFICNGNVDLTSVWRGEFDMEWLATPTSGYHYSSIVITETGPHELSDLMVIGPITNWLRVILRCGSNGVYYYLDRCVNGSVVQLTQEMPLATAEKTPTFKMVNNNGNLSFYVDEAGGTDYSRKWEGNTGLNFKTQYMQIIFGTNTITSGTIKINDINTYNYIDGEDSGVNVVCLPANSTLTSTADFTRTTEDGDIACYTTPYTPLYFQTTPNNYYDGSVKAYNSNYSDSTPRLITWIDEVLDPADFYVTNGLVKLTTNASTTTPIVMSYYSSPGYVDLQHMNVGGSIKHLKPLLISPEQHIYQINDTKWTISRGKQHIIVEHPTTPIIYTKDQYYYHDSTLTTSPAADANISMTTQHYTNIYSTPDYITGFQIIQLEPTTIKSDSIPPANITGLGWYQSTPTHPQNNYLNLSREFLSQTRQSINLRML